MIMFRQAKWNEPVVFELGHSGRQGYIVPKIDDSMRDAAGDIRAKIPEELLRKSPPKLPELSEVEVVRHYTRLSQMNYSIDLGLYPLGSCTMKYNPKINDLLALQPGLTHIHPYQNDETIQGIFEILYTLSKWLSEITGTYDVSLHPAAGAHGEFLGAILIRAYHEFNDELSNRTELIVPDSAHGTNPASARMAGFDVVFVPSDESGCIDIDVLETAVSDKTAGLMLTNPNTLGIFEENIEQIASIIHQVGGLLYYDGANLNAILGKVRPGDMGFDIIHINIHKTFGTPHGGGGPGAGPIGVCKELAKFLPIPRIVYDDEGYRLNYNYPHSIGKVGNFYGNVAVLLKAYAYILCLGAEGLKETAEISVLNANYLVKKIEEIGVYKLPYDANRPRKHECVFSTKALLREKGIRAIDISKRLLNYGMHAPTIYFPSIVEEALMIEPTESFEKEELDRFVNAMQRIAEEARVDPERILKAPTNTSIRRLDEAKASNPKTIALSWQMHKKKSNHRH